MRISDWSSDVCSSDLLVDVARDRVLLHSEVRYPPGMNDVVAGDQEADLLADRQHQRVVDIDEIVATIDLLQLFEISRAEGAIKAAPMGTDRKSTRLNSSH